MLKYIASEMKYIDSNARYIDSKLKYIDSEVTYIASEIAGMKRGLPLKNIYNNKKLFPAFRCKSSAEKAIFL